jgi:serine phosphatase RsbU (regulator of sigma subunit)/anti-sigma regulatory factor (Ser/Thr protein kinase)
MPRPSLAPGNARNLEDAFARRGIAYRRHLAMGALLTVLLLVAAAASLARGQYHDAQRTALANARASAVLAGSVIDARFSGKLATLHSIANSPSVVQQRTARMRAYFERLEPKARPGLFSAGLVWVDRTGLARVSAVRGSLAHHHDLPARSLVGNVIATGRPFVSEGITAWPGGERVIVVAVPTRDAHGRLTGVLAAALLPRPLAVTRGSVDLGDAGQTILDRGGRSVLSGFRRPVNGALLRTLSGTGTRADTRGLDGSPAHAIAFATSAVPGWTIVIDRPRSVLFSDARRGFFLELALVAAAATIVLFLIALVLLHGRRAAARDRKRSRQRHELTRKLGDASVGSDVSEGLVEALADVFPGALCIVALESPDGRGLALSGSADGAFASSESAREIVVEEAAALAHDSGCAIAIGRDPELHEALPDVHAALFGAAQSLYATPLVTHGGSRLGAVCLLFGHTHALDEGEQAQVTWYAEQAAQALDRTSAFEREHEVAVRLQRSLLSQRLPEVEGVELIGRYNAGVAGLEVGGDWYDAVRRADGIVHVTVGDVAGHGVTAAVLMGQLRNAFRAHAYEHTSPAELLRRMLRHVDEDEMATALCLTLDPYTQELTYASAGHPPSLLVDGDAATVLRLGHALAPPLGYVQASAIREVTLDLPAGATLVAYTDGLVERRGWSIDTGIDLLASVVGSASSLAAAPLADRIFEEVAPRIGSNDDIALLIMRLLHVPQRMDIEVAGDPAGMSTLRRRLRAWLELRGLADDERDDAILAVSEACNNAIEHAYALEQGPIRVLLQHSEGALAIRVEDQGAWQETTSGFERGRGILVMRAVMDTAEIEHDEDGTRVSLSRLLA